MRTIFTGMGAYSMDNIFIWYCCAYSEGIRKHAPRKQSLKIMSFEIHLEKNCSQIILQILLCFQYLDIVSKRLLGAFSGMRPDDFNLNCEF